MADFVYQHCPK